MAKASRRRFLKTSAVAAAGGLVAPYVTRSRAVKAQGREQSANDRPVLGCIGTGDRWKAVGPNAMQFADCVAVCDVDANHLAEGVSRVVELQGRAPQVYENHEQLLERPDIDVVTIVTPDHWHARIAIDAMRAGKDVYCEKPLTLTIEEGKQICEVVRETGRVFQVGTQQRSEMGLRFLHAVAMVRDGRIGELQKIDVAIGGSPTSGAIPSVTVPKGLNWERWLGQAPWVDFRYQELDGSRWGNSRCHYEFRWWYEYSGGKLTDWGAHHVDIAQWAIDQVGPGQGPTRIEPVSVVHPVPLVDGHPTRDDQYNCATKFEVRVDFPGGVVMNIHDSCEDDPALNFSNGIMFTGTQGRFLVNRERLSGAPVEALADEPLAESLLKSLYKGRQPTGGNAHMRNFFECVAARDEPVSDVYSHHRALTTCHLANIAIRLNRSLEWDPANERIVGDDEANAWQAREQRKGYEVTV